MYSKPRCSDIKNSMLETTSIKDRFFAFFAALIILFTSWTIYYHLPLDIFFQGLLALLIFRFYGDYSKKRIHIFFVFLFISLWFFRPMGFDMKGLFLGIFRAIVPCSLIIMESKIQKQTLKYLFLLIAIIAGIGAILHVLNISGIYLLNLITIVETPERDFAIYPFLVYIYPSSMRFSSIFDEPGYLGTIIALYLSIEQFDFKKKTNVILLICGILSLSFGFYVMVALGLALDSVLKKKILPVVIALFILIAAYLSFPEFFDVLLDRDEITSLGNGGSYSDSRGGLKEMQKNINIINSMPFLNMLIGNGYDAPLFYFKENTNSIASSSIFRLIFQMGYLGCFFLIFSVFRFSKKSFDSLIFIFLFVFSLYQRPQIFVLMYFIMFANILKLNGNKRKCVSSHYQDVAN